MLHHCVPYMKDPTKNNKITLTSNSGAVDSYKKDFAVLIKTNFGLNKINKMCSAFSNV